MASRFEKISNIAHVNALDPTASYIFRCVECQQPLREANLDNHDCTQTKLIFGTAEYWYIGNDKYTCMNCNKIVHLFLLKSHSERHRIDIEWDDLPQKETTAQKSTAQQTLQPIQQPIDHQLLPRNAPQQPKASPLIPKPIPQRPKTPIKPPNINQKQIVFETPGQKQPEPRVSEQKTPQAPQDDEIICISEQVEESKIPTTPTPRNIIKPILQSSVLKKQQNAAQTISNQTQLPVKRSRDDIDQSGFYKRCREARRAVNRLLIIYRRSREVILHHAFRMYARPKPQQLLV